MSVPELVLRLTRAADRDLEEIAMYTGHVWGSAQHTRYRAAIDRAFVMLRDHPGAGRSRDDLYPGCRSLPVQQHVIFYDQPDSSTIVVRRVLHARRDAVAEVKDPNR